MSIGETERESVIVKPIPFSGRGATTAVFSSFFAGALAAVRAATVSATAAADIGCGGSTDSNNGQRVRGGE